MRRNFFWKAILLIAIINSLAACTMLQSKEPARPPLRVGYTQRWGDYTLLVAQEKGLFEKYGVTVEPVYYEVFSKTFSSLASGQIDSALIAMGDTINIDRSAHMKVIGVSDDGGADAIVVGPEITSIEQLKGKTVGVLLGTQYEIMITEMLRSVNMNAGDVTLVGIEPENASDALKNGQVQAVYTWEPYLSEAVSNGNTIIYPKEKTRLFPDVIVFRASIVENRPEDIRAFMKAWFEAVDYRLQNPEETQALAAKYIGVNIETIKIDDNVKILSLKENKAMFDVQNENSIYAVTKRTSDFLISIGAVAQQFDPLELLDPDYLP
jgi:NitT/TauT family transport system substrate-binding protein